MFQKQSFKFSPLQAGHALLAFLFLAVSLFVSATALNARPLDDVIETNYLRVFVYEDFAPYSYKDENKKMVGIDVEIARRLAEKLGVELRLFVRGADESVDDDLAQQCVERALSWRRHCRRYDARAR